MNKPTFEIEKITFESDKWKDEFVEKGASLEHVRWAKWQYYLHTCLIWNDTIKNWELTNEQKERWDRQIRTPYDQLSESEKESDRKESRVYLPLVEKILKQQKKELLSQTEQECDKKWKEKALGNEKLLKDIHRLELDAISCMSLEKFVKWSDDRKEKSKTKALDDLRSNK